MPTMVNEIFFPSTRVSTKSNSTWDLSSCLTQLSNASSIIFACTFVTGTAALWFYILVQSNEVPTTWELFKTAVQREFVADEHARKARDEKLRKLCKVTSVSKYISDFLTRSSAFLILRKRKFLSCFCWNHKGAGDSLTLELSKDPWWETTSNYSSHLQQHYEYAIYCRAKCRIYFTLLLEL